MDREADFFDVLASGVRIDGVAIVWGVGANDDLERGSAEASVVDREEREVREREIRCTGRIGTDNDAKIVVYGGDRV